MMIEQGAISVEVGETDAAVTNFPEVVPLANMAHGLGLFEDLDRLLAPKELDRGLANSAAVFDLMCIPLSGAERIDDLGQMRKDAGLTRLLGRSVMAPSTAHNFLRRIRYHGLEGPAKSGGACCAGWRSGPARRPPRWTATLRCSRRRARTRG